LKSLLTNRVAIINGGTTGMGRSTAILFAEEGCNCVVAGMSEAKGKQTAEEASRKGAECIYVPCDITDLKQIKKCVDKTIKKFGKVDILVGCAGGSNPKRAMSVAPEPIARPQRGIQHTDEKFYDMMMALNLKGHVFFCKEVAPYMIKQNYGKIVLISSMGVFSPPAPSIEYHTAKAGILGLTYNLAFELAPHNINVNAILPGPIITPFWDNVLGDMTEKQKTSFFENLGKNTPLGRAGTPEDIANTVLFLSSEMGSYITGQAINVGGGIPLSRYTGGGFGTSPEK
jgi:NAD(P)-dependent dehydrogenase (short-subunit alcohol dehydrogenase family)